MKHSSVLQTRLLEISLLAVYGRTYGLQVEHEHLLLSQIVLQENV